LEEDQQQIEGAHLHIQKNIQPAPSVSLCVSNTHTHTAATAAAVITIAWSSYPHNVPFHHTALNFKGIFPPKK